MNKKEYLDCLSRELGSLPYNDVKEITDEIEAHFDMAMAEGKTEEQISDDLGDVKELAQWKPLNPKMVKRRRCWEKSLTDKPLSPNPMIKNLTNE